MNNSDLMISRIMRRLETERRASLRVIDAICPISSSISQMPIEKYFNDVLAKERQTFNECQQSFDLLYNLLQKA
jgi:hypothetical protein